MREFITIVESDLSRKLWVNARTREMIRLPPSTHHVTDVRSDPSKYGVSEEQVAAWSDNDNPYWDTGLVGGMLGLGWCRVGISPGGGDSFSIMAGSREDAQTACTILIDHFGLFSILYVDLLQDRAITLHFKLGTDRAVKRFAVSGRVHPKHLGEPSYTQHQ